MSLADSLVVQLREYVNGGPAHVDESDIFYKFRKPGPHFEAPFPVANMAACAGVATEIEGETPIDYILFVIDNAGDVDNEYTKDRTEFLMYDFARYDFKGQTLVDANYTNRQLLRRYKYIKKMC